jgi:hypothetical protein
VPFFSASEIDLSVQWGALLNGAIVSEIEVRRPKVNFVTASSAGDEPKGDEKSKDDEKAAKDDDDSKGKAQKPSESKQEQVEPASNWTAVVQKLTPIRINRFSIIDGEVHYRDFGTKPKVDVYVQDINAEARNLTNSKGESGSLVATFDGRARAMHSGKLRFEGKVDPYAKKPTFDAAFRLNGLELTQLNSYLRAFANVDVEKGTFSLDAEFAAKNGEFEGYVKPFIDKLDVLRWNQEEESFVNKLWQGAVELTSELLQDQSKDRTASRVPIKGRFEQPDIGVWSAVGSLLRNAFIEALRRGLEGSVDVQKVAGKESEAVERTEPEKDGGTSDDPKKSQ